MRIVGITVAFAAGSLLYAMMMDVLSGMSLRQSIRSMTSYIITATTVEYALALFWAILLAAAWTSRFFRRKSRRSGS